MPMGRVPESLRGETIVRVIGLAGEHSSEVSGVFLNLWVSMEEVVGPCDVPQEQSLCIGVEWIEVYS
jgi:hypothetical protein